MQQGITVSQLERALAAREKLAVESAAGRSTDARVDSISGATMPQESFRVAAQSRFEAAKYLNAGGGQVSRSVFMVEEPFLIWATWTPHLTPHRNILEDSSTEPGNSWAKIIVDADGSDDQGVDLLDSLTFYYVWENATTYTTVVDVSTFMTVSGAWQAEADFYLRHRDPGDPDGGTAVPGSAHLELSANLALYLWWNDPPTLAPLLNAPDQQTQISLVNVDLHAGPEPVEQSGFVFNWFELNQSLLVIPPDGVLVAEVSFDVDHGATAGRVLADFFNGDGNQITSHWLQVAYVVGPPLTGTPVVFPGPART